MSGLSKNILHELKGLFTVSLYVLNFLLMGAYLAWVGGVLGPHGDLLGIPGLDDLREGFLHHLFAILSTIIASFSLDWWLFQRQHRELKALIRIMYETFYSDIRSEDKTIYRVSCYRYREGALIRGWRRYWCLRTKKMLTRRPLPGSPFLECIARYGHEGRKPVRRPTTLTMSVSHDNVWSEGFAGLIAREQRQMTVQTQNVNLAAARVRFEGDLAKQREELWTEVQRGMEGHEREIAWKAVKSVCNLKALSPQDSATLEKFVIDTNTPPYLLLSVKGGREHCNNFFGFPVFAEDRLWGVVTIDALDARFEEKMKGRLSACLAGQDGANLPGDFVSRWIEQQLEQFAIVFRDFVQP